jgi:hypothetical protein
MELLESESQRPRQVRYQAALRPDITEFFILPQFMDLTSYAIRLTLMPIKQSKPNPVLGRERFGLHQHAIDHQKIC